MVGFAYVSMSTTLFALALLAGFLLPARGVLRKDRKHLLRKVLFVYLIGIILLASGVIFLCLLILTRESHVYMLVNILFLEAIGALVVGENYRRAKELSRRSIAPRPPAPILTIRCGGCDGEIKIVERRHGNLIICPRCGMRGRIISKSP